MSVGFGLMNMYFGYNTRVGDVEGLTKAVGEYEKIAVNAETPEERERYANAAKQIKNEMLPQMREEMNNYAKQLGLDTDEVGKVITKDELEEKENIQKHTLFEYLEDGTSNDLYSYKAGQFLEKDV